MDEQMFCFQCEQAAGCTACTGAAGVCGKSAETAAAQDRLTGALIAFAGQLIAAGRGPTPEQARLLMQGLFTTITNVNFDPAAVDALTRRVHDASPGTGPDYDMQALWREPDADRRSLKCFVLFSLRGMAAYNYHPFFAVLASRFLFFLQSRQIHKVFQKLPHNAVHNLQKLPRY